MPNDDKRTGPPEDVAAHLAETLNDNGAIDQVADSELGDSLAAQTGYLSGHTQPTGWEPWAYDGTSLVLLDDIIDGSEGSEAGLYSGFAVLHGHLYFSAFDPITSAYVLYQYDGTEASVVSTQGQDPGIVSGLIPFNGKLYYNAYDPTLGWELHVYDPATNNVVAVDLHFDADTLHPSGSFPRDFFEFNGDLYFTAHVLITDVDATEIGPGAELYKVEGDSGDVVLVEDINPGGNSHPETSLS